MPEKKLNVNQVIKVRTESVVILMSVKVITAVSSDARIWTEATGVFVIGATRSESMDLVVWILMSV